MPRKQKYKVRVLYKGQIIREVIAKDWHVKERNVQELSERYPKAEIITELHPKPL